MPDPILRRVVLETTLKPFADLSAAGLRRTCEAMLAQWAPLTGCARELAVLFWTGDGDELFRWAGRFDQPIDWGRYVGFCGTRWDRVPPCPQAPAPYRDEPVTITYQHLKDIVATFKHVGASRYGLTVRCGTTVDPGPEFIYSTFKLEEHPELLVGGRGDVRGDTVPFVCGYAALHADPTPRAGWPDGVPEGTPFGAFLGRQATAFCAALGFDYLWLSNGLAYSAYPWVMTGRNFDGERFDLGPFGDEAERVVSFWRELKAAAPDLPLEVRGTNYPVGMELGADAVPHRRVAELAGLASPPVNPPWGSIDLGMELATWLSRLAAQPSAHIGFRAYVNDPWFWHNPWYDFYGHEPFDLYVPLSCSRITGDGGVQVADSAAFLTVDTERGELDELVPREVIPAVRHGLDHLPDEPGPVAWLYPFDELQDAAAAGAEGQALAWFADLYVRAGINAGLPLNTVLSTREFATVPLEPLLDTVLVTLLPRQGSAYVERLLEFMETGGRVLFYGPTTGADEAILTRLNLRTVDGIEGQLEPVTPREHAVLHEAALSAGPLAAIVAEPRLDTIVHLALKQGAEQRVYALRRGGAAWVRGSAPVRLTPGVAHPQPLPPDVRDPGVWLPRLLADLGVVVEQQVLPGGRRGALFMHRHDNAWWFTGHKPDATSSFGLALADGVPVLAERQTRIDRGRGWYALDRSFSHECRVFVRQDGGVVGCTDELHPPGTHRKLRITGLDEAVLTIYPPLDCIEDAEVDGAVAVLADEDRGVITVIGASDTVTITW